MNGLGAMKRSSISYLCYNQQKEQIMGAIKKEYFPSYLYDDYLLWEGDWEIYPINIINHNFAIISYISWRLFVSFIVRR